MPNPNASLGWNGLEGPSVKEFNFLLVYAIFAVERTICGFTYCTFTEQRVAVNVDLTHNTAAVQHNPNSVNTNYRLK
jgi:hypothetical protein